MTKSNSPISQRYQVPGTKSQENMSKSEVVKQWNVLQPLLHAGLDILTACKILTIVIVPKTLHNSFLWDLKHSISFHPFLKKLPYIPFSPPTETLHVMADIPPTPVSYSSARLSLLKKNFADGNLGSLSIYTKSQL